MCPSDLSSNAASIPLSIQTDDSSDELYLIDAHFNLVTQAFGTLTTTVSPGVYKLKQRAGEDIREDHIIVRAGDTRVERRYPRLQFSSPAPLADTATTHEYHLAAAYRESRLEHVRAGQGSWIFVMARHWTRSGAVAEGAAHPAAGLTLHRIGAAGTVDAPLADFEVQSAGDKYGDPWSACNVCVDPGAYLLTLQLPSGRVFRQTVIAAPGWQAQLFLMQRLIPREQVYRPDLLETAVLMGQGIGFDPLQREHRVTEQARLGLVNRRPVLREESARVLRGQFVDPMLGLFGAHLLLDDAEPDLALVREVVQTLRTGLQADHPDVNALALAASPPPALIPTATFAMPPMLRRSWAIVQRAAEANAALVPEESLVDYASERLWGPSVWFVWESSPDARDDVVAIANADLALEGIVESYVRQRARRASRQSDPAIPAAFMAMPAMPTDAQSAVAPVETSWSSDLLTRVASAAHEIVAHVPGRAKAIPTAADRLGVVQTVLHDADAVLDLARAMNVPKHKLQRELEALTARIAERNASIDQSRRADL